MERTFSRRNAIAMAGIGALGVSSAIPHHSFAQGEATSHIFANGIELSWEEPWIESTENAVAEVFTESVLLGSTGGAEVLVGYYESEVVIDDALTAMLSLVLGDGAEAVNVAGGSEETTFEGATVTREFRVHSISQDGEEGSLFAQLTDGMEMKVIFSPAFSFAASMVSANDSITLDGVEVFADVSGEEVQQTLGAAGEFGEYTDVPDNFHVQYPASWQVVSQDEFGIELANPAGTLIFSALTEPLSGSSLTDVPGWFMADQGPEAVGSTPVVDGDILTFATDGEYGLRLGQAELVDDPLLVLVLMVRDFEGKGDDATVMLDEVRAAILVNGKQPFPGLETHITEIAPA